MSDITFDFTSDKRMIVHDLHAEPWRVTVVDTGLHTSTSGRVGRIKKYIGNEPFMLTYGDGGCDVNIRALVSFHNSNKTIATLTSVQQKQQKGVLEVDIDNTVHAFREKAAEDGAFINAGYMVLEPDVFKYIHGDDTIFETDVLSCLAQKGELKSFLHTGFWQCMDTLYEKNILEKLWNEKRAPWCLWE